MFFPSIQLNIGFRQGHFLQVKISFEQPLHALSDLWRYLRR